MRDWIVGLQKAATERGQGFAASEWEAVESTVGQPVPTELRDLYEAMDGAVLQPDVRLIHFHGTYDYPGVLEWSRQPPEGLPSAGVWLFGTKGEDQPLFAVRKRELMQLDGGAPEWLSSVGDEEWIFGFRNAAGDLRLYRTLEGLLARLVPPAQTEEFGDITYARALVAVQGALGQLGEEDLDRTRKVDVYPPPEARPPRAARKAPRKPAPKKSKAKAKKKPARKAGKVARKKAKPAARKKAKPVRKKVKASARRAKKPARRAKARRR